jgi:hypothetical protein
MMPTDLRDTPQASSLSELLDDEIIKEVRAIREAISGEYDFDLDRLHAAMRAREANSDRPKLTPMLRTLELVEESVGPQQVD